ACGRAERIGADRVASRREERPPRLDQRAEGARTVGRGRPEDGAAPPVDRVEPLASAAGEDDVTDDERRRLVPVAEVRAPDLVEVTAGVARLDRRDAVPLLRPVS